MKLGFDKITIEINKLVLSMQLIFLLDYGCLRIYEKCPAKNIPMIYYNIKYNNNKYNNNKNIM